MQAWVESTGYHEYREAFAEGRVNGKVLLSMDAALLHSELILPSAELADLLKMEIDELRARRGLFSRAERDAHYATHPLADNWDVADVMAFLRDVGFVAAAARFGQAQINGPALLQMSDEELRLLVAPQGGTAKDPYEHTLADAEQVAALVAHLRWRSAGARGGAKDEL